MVAFASIVVIVTPFAIAGMLPSIGSDIRFVEDPLGRREDCLRSPRSSVLVREKRLTGGYFRGAKADYDKSTVLL